MASLFLQPDELRELTGYARGKYQCDWLKENGYQFDKDREGKPKVKRCLFTYHEPLNIKHEEQEEEAKPNFEAI